MANFTVGWFIIWGWRTSHQISFVIGGRKKLEQKKFQLLPVKSKLWKDHQDELPARWQFDTASKNQAKTTPNLCSSSKPNKKGTVPLNEPVTAITLQEIKDTLKQQGIQHTVLESSSWWGWANTLSTLAGSANVTKPKPLKRDKRTRCVWGGKEKRNKN